MSQQKNAPADFSQMSEKDLKKLAADAAEELAARERKRRERLERKQKYALKTPEPEFQFNYYRFRMLVMELGRDKPEIKDLLQDIEKRCNEKLPYKKEEVYPCPECGEMSLFPGSFGGDARRGWKYKIRCSYCDFVAPVKGYSEEHDAWDEFHEWLLKEGYLKE